MARGKYKSTAEAREARETAIQEAARLRREVDRLTKSVEDLERENLAQQAAHIETTSELRLMIAKNTSGRVEELTSQLDFAKAEIKSVSEKNAEVRASHERLFRLVGDHFVNEHGWTGADALQYIADKLGFNGYITEDQTGKRAGAEGAYRIELARGIRSTKTPSGLTSDEALNKEGKPW